MTWPEPPNYYEHPKAPFKVILQQPDYPVVFAEPSVSQVVSNMRATHWSWVAGMAALGYGLGYWKGHGIHWQKPASYFGAAFFGKSALLWGMGDTAYRLMGYRENGVEVTKNLPGLLQKEAY
mmetsp:Transcript_13724/g.29499  ORF Transcript_13724/g.29499 Transcript_13724/m.29499 type:complete len:122 (+) Transcript_13724:90-455(+)|eukprot:CAMPEP_0202900994 /NCGR_PEP_ID=MMETSP1392-20130828/12620_1 /ASSEMBLY_ACC=CAM_ASM_000868 /TAXON_ID=225041 /ORGANISM="Chlamydomonas chlamydogama, Strain SAG 11-48b" /LENGTH=121 /DNA_ID=CAMNT_0049587473 /DNA_START=94 /DNA_END=459 /DNA_ORIENTATION=-